MVNFTPFDADAASMLHDFAAMAATPPYPVFPPDDYTREIGFATSHNMDYAEVLDLIREIRSQELDQGPTNQIQDLNGLDIILTCYYATWTKP